MATLLASHRPSRLGRRKRKAYRSGPGTSLVGQGWTCPASPRRSTLKCGAGSTITGPSTAPSCAFLAWRINEHLARWAMHKFKRFRRRYLRAMEWLQRIYRRNPKLFVHWQLVVFTADRPGPDDGRLLRPVLRERAGEVPARHSPFDTGSASGTLPAPEAPFGVPTESERAVIMRLSSECTFCTMISRATQESFTQEPSLRAVSTVGHGLSLTRFRGHFILAERPEEGVQDGSAVEVPGGVPARGGPDGVGDR